MRPERYLSDGSADYGQGIIGPSSEDIFFSKNQADSPPLRPFPSRRIISLSTAVAAPFAVAGCISTTPQEGVTNKATSNTSQAENFNSAFSDFIAEYKDTTTEEDPVRVWLDRQGISSEILGSNGVMDLLKKPNQTLKDEISKNRLEMIFQVFGERIERTQEGDIVLLPGNSDFPMGFFGIATGEEEIQKEIDGDVSYAKVLIHYPDGSNAITNVNTYEVMALLRASKGGDFGQDTLVAKAETRDEVYKRFFDKYNGEFVEKNDASRPDRINTCVDLLVALADEIDVPREAVTGLIEAKNYYQNPKESTREYFEIIPYADEVEIQKLDVVVFGPGIGAEEGHVAISNGKVDRKGGTLQAFSQNYPTKSNAHEVDLPLEDVIGILRPKGFERSPKPTPKATKNPTPAPTEESVFSTEFVPKNDEELVRYRIAELLLSAFRGSGFSGRRMEQFGLPKDQDERVKRALARGERIEESIPFSEVILLPFDGHSKKPTLYVHDPNGDLYEWDMELVKGTIRDWKINVYPDADMPEVRNQEYLRWQGEVRIEGVVEFGTVMLNVIGTFEDFKRWEEDIFNFSGFGQIYNLGTMDRTGDNEVNSSIYNAVYLYESGDIECGSSESDCLRPLNNIFGLSPEAERYGAFNGWHDYKP